MKFRNIKKIALNDCRSAFRKRTIYISAAILGFALLISLLIGWQNAKTLNQHRQKYQEIVSSNWLEQPDRHPHRSAHYGYLAFRPKSSLSFFDAGVDSFAGTSIFLEAHRQNTVNFSEARHSNGLLRFGELNLSMILQMILPLLIFFIGFSAISGERESGTLHLLISQGASWAEIIFGKALAILSIILAILLPLMAFSIFLWSALDESGTGNTGLLRLLLLIAAYFAFFIVCSAIAVVVSAFSKTSRRSIIALTAIWVFFWVAMPRSIQNLGSSLYPAPSKSQFDKMLEEDLAKEGDSHNPGDPKFKELKEEALAKYGVSDIKDLPFNYAGYVMAKAEEISSGIFRRHYGKLLETFRKQNRITEFAGLLNPYLAIKHFSMAAAGSDFSAYEDFQWQAEEFRFNMIQKLNDLHANKIKAENDRQQKVSKETWKEFPQFEYREKTISEALSGQGAAIFSIFLWLAVSMAGLGLAAKRVKI